MLVPPTPSDQMGIQSDSIGLYYSVFLVLDNSNEHGRCVKCWKDVQKCSKRMKLICTWILLHVFSKWLKNFHNFFSQFEPQQMHYYFFHHSTSKLFGLPHLASLRHFSSEYASNFNWNFPCFFYVPIKPKPVWSEFEATFRQVRLWFLRLNGIQYLDSGLVLHVFKTGARL